MEKSVCSMLIEKGIPFECQVLLEDNLARMEQADGSELVSVDKEFHELLIRATENELFSMISGMDRSGAAPCEYKRKGKLA